MLLNIFFVFAVPMLGYAVLMVWQGRRFLQHVRQAAAEPLPEYAPPASVICPCKGLDPEMDLNLGALLTQDYPDYEVVFVVAEASDPAHAVCTKLAAVSRVPARVVVAGLSEGRGEKVHNLETGVRAARAESEVLVFADSDGRPPPDWTRILVAHLSPPGTGAASTFRWYIPDGDFLSGLQSAWNALTAAYFTWEGGRRLCWGGGTALRRETFFGADVPRYWAGCISDDLMMSRALREAGKPIVFVPQCLVATHHPVTWGQFLGWGTRQITLMRIYEPGTWRAGFLALALYSATFLYGLALAGLWLGSRAMESGLILLALAVISGLMAAKGSYWSRAAQLLVPAHREELRRGRWSPAMLAPLAPFVLSLNFLLSMFLRRFEWRGVTYLLESPWKTVVIRDKD